MMCIRWQSFKVDANRPKLQTIRIQVRVWCKNESPCNAEFIMITRKQCCWLTCLYDALETAQERSVIPVLPQRIDHFALLWGICYIVLSFENMVGLVRADNKSAWASVKYIHYQHKTTFFIYGSCRFLQCKSILWSWQRRRWLVA